MAQKKQPLVLQSRAPGFADFDEQRWPVNLLLVLFAACLAAVVLATSDFHSPRLLENGWFHLGALALIMTVLVWGAARLDRRLQRRTQLGVLLSLLVHLWLCMVSYNIYLSSVAQRERDAPETVAPPAPVTLPDYDFHDESTDDATDPELNVPLDTQLDDAQAQAQRQEIETPQERPVQPDPNMPPVQPVPPVIEQAEMAAPRRAAELPGPQPSRQEHRLADTSEHAALPEVQEAQERTLESPVRLERSPAHLEASRPLNETSLPDNQAAPAAMARRPANEQPLEPSSAMLARKQATAATAEMERTTPEPVREAPRVASLGEPEAKVAHTAPAARAARQVQSVRETQSVAVDAPLRRAQQSISSDQPRLESRTAPRLAKAGTRADTLDSELEVPEPVAAASGEAEPGEAEPGEAEGGRAQAASIDRIAATVPNAAPTASAVADSRASAALTTFQAARAQPLPELSNNSMVSSTNLKGSRRTAIATSGEVADGEAAAAALPAVSDTRSTEPAVAALGKTSNGTAQLARQDSADTALSGTSTLATKGAALDRPEFSRAVDIGSIAPSGPARVARSRVVAEAMASMMEPTASANTAGTARPAETDVSNATPSPSGGVGGEELALADLGSQRQAAALPVLARAPSDIGGLRSAPSFDFGVPDRLARPESEVAHLDRGRFLLKRSGVSRAAELRVKDVAVPGYRQRDRQQRQELARQRGGSEGSEKAVEMGLDFLARHQNAEGSWSLQKFSQGRPGYEHAGDGQMVSDTAATGLAMLAFLGAGYTHTDGKYRLVATRGLNYLLGNQRPEGDLFLPQEARSNLNVWLYSHGIAAIALCEAYGMTRDPTLKQPAQRALDFIVAAQHPVEGGWRYAPRQGSDTSVSGWQLMALKSGELAGLQVPDAAYAKVGHWLDGAHAPGEREKYVYRPKSSKSHQNSASRVMTAEALLMRQYSGWTRDHRLMTAGADFLMSQLPDWSVRPEWQRDSYYWYYATQVMFQMGGQHWDAWNECLRPLLVEHQEQGGLFAGSWEPLGETPDRWGREGGRIYVTAMHLLMLEVYYRHLPLYRTLEE